MSEDKTKKTAEKPSPVVQKRVTRERESLVYVGPNFKNGTINTYQVFIGGVLPDHVQEAVNSNKKLKALFVKVKALNNARRELQDKNSALSTIYKEVARG